MKKIFLAAAVALSSAMVQVQALAQDDTLYMGLQYSLLGSEIDTQAGGDDGEADAMNLIAGYRIDENWAVEVLLGTMINDPRENGNLDVELKTVFGISGVYRWPLTEQLNVFGKLGVGHVELDDNANRSADGTDIIYGAGVAYDLTEDFGLTAEYMIYPDAEFDSATEGYDVEMTAVNLGFYLRF